MLNPKAEAVVSVAVALLNKQPPIPYVLGGENTNGMDCQGLIEYCVRKCGGSMSFSGSNDMFRNACAWTGTLAEARAEGMLVPGAVLFIVKSDGGEPDKYKADGLGNASHIGLYTDTRAEVMHASSSKGSVCATTLAGGWTHVGLLKAVDYDTGEETTSTKFAVADAPTGSTVNMRSTPSGAYMLKIPIGTSLPVLLQKDGWCQTEFDGFKGWVNSSFLRFEDEPVEPDEPIEPTNTLPEAILAKVEAAYRALGGMLGR